MTRRGFQHEDSPRFWPIMTSEKFEVKFKTDMDNLLNIVQADALKLLKNLEDRDFLIAQRELERKWLISSLYLVLTQEEDAAQK